MDDGYVGPLRLVKSMLRMGEPEPRTLSSPTANMQIDSMGFVQGFTGVASMDKVGTHGTNGRLPGFQVLAC